MSLGLASLSTCSQLSSFCRSLTLPLVGEGGQLGGLEQGLRKASRLAEASRDVRNIRSPEVWLSRVQVSKPAQLSLILAKAPRIQILGGEC